MRQFADTRRELFGMLVDVLFSDMTSVERCLSGVAMVGHTTCRCARVKLLWFSS